MNITPAGHADPAVAPDDRVICVATDLLTGELAAGDVLLDGRRIGRLSRRVLPAHLTARAFGLGRPRDPADDQLTWYVEAVGWVPHSDRPWDRRITHSAPTRRRAIEDLLRAYGNRR
jgi:hypothetical protein